MVLCTPKVVSADYDILAIVEVGNISWELQVSWEIIRFKYIEYITWNYPNHKNVIVRLLKNDNNLSYVYSTL